MDIIAIVLAAYMVGAAMGVLAIVPLAIAAIWIDVLMAWASPVPVLEIMAGTFAGMIVHGR
jgi:hypothetical protein